MRFNLWMRHLHMLRTVLLEQTAITQFEDMGGQSCDGGMKQVLSKVAHWYEEMKEVRGLVYKTLPAYKNVVEH